MLDRSPNAAISSILSAGNTKHFNSEKVISEKQYQKNLELARKWTRDVAELNKAAERAGKKS